MSAPSEPRNPFYLLMLIVGMIFVATVLAYAVVPMLEEKARDAGTEPPASPFRESLRTDGWKWVLVEVAALVILSLLSMGLDRYRRWKIESTAAADKPGDAAPPSTNHSAPPS
ncbi:MAG TPA: hypothetical protein VFE62_08925 [Gemmataceae bacterium]|nr:hypothetical protein [Gemmataceae bacterium]